MTGTDRLVSRFESGVVGGGAYSSGWSPAGDRLLLSLSQEVPCGEAGPQGGDVCQSWQLLLVDAGSGQTKLLGHGVPDTPYVAWAPSGGELAFSTTQGSYLVSADGELRELAGTAGLHVFDWSPDGRYLGFVENGPREALIAVLDTTSGEVRTVLEETGKDISLEARWWR